LLGTRKPKNSAVFISGGGSTLQALLEHQMSSSIRLVVSNRKKAAGLLKAKRFGCQTFYFGKEQSYSDLSQKLTSMKIEAIFLAGFMKILPEDFVADWEGKIFNIHPSLLPEFPGLNSFERSFQSGSRVGATIHAVNHKMDEGQIFLQKEVPLLKIVQNKKRDHSVQMAEIALRQTEQHLLREFSIRKWI